MSSDIERIFVISTGRIVEKNEIEGKFRRYFQSLKGCGSGGQFREWRARTDRKTGRWPGVRFGGIFVSLFSPAELEAIRQIDLRQNQLLEDLDALNGQILGILKEHGFIADSQSPPAECPGVLPQFPLPEMTGDGSGELESAA